MITLSGAQIPGGPVLKTSNAGAAPDGDHVQCMAPAPVIGGGCSPYQHLDLDETGRVIKAGPGQLYELFAFNSTAGIVYVKLYNKATAPTEADTPVRVFAVPAGGGINPLFVVGLAFAAGISARCVTEVADSGTTGPSANGCTLGASYA